MADISLAELGKRTEPKNAELSLNINPLQVSPLALLGQLARKTTGDLFFPIERMQKGRKAREGQ